VIDIDPVLLEAFRYSHVKSSYLSVYEGTTLVSEVVGISSGSVKADRNQKARRSLECTIPLSQWQDVVGLNVIGSRVQAWTGYDLGGRKIVVPIGAFRVDELGRAQGGTLQVTASSLESYVIDDIFIDQLPIYTGANVVNEIKRLITESLPDVIFELDAFATSMSGVLLDKDLFLERDRWDTVIALAAFISCDVYCTPAGKFRIAKRPSMTDLVPVWRINEGPDGVLVAMNTKVSRANTFNGVLAMGQSSNADVIPCSYLLLDTDVSSPMRWGGPFGKKLYVYSDENLTTTAKCQAKAEELLAFYKAEDRNLDFSAIPNPALEPDDAVQVSMLDGTVETHLITSMTIPLGLGAWTAETLSNKDTGVLNP